MSARRACLSRMLGTCTMAWERKQQRRERTEGTRDYKAALRCRGYYSQPGVQRSIELCSSSSIWAAMPTDCRSSSLRCLAFRLLARSTAVLFQNIILPERAFPIQLFKLVDASEPQVFRDICAEFKARPCLFDP
eukprot:6077486-Pyramimonas_sp.AAC.1